MQNEPVKNTRKKIPRNKIAEQNPSERVQNFGEVELGYSEEQAVLESMRCLMCKNPKCIEGCPVEIDIKGFIAYIKDRKFKEALEKIRDKNTMPGICGRVCPQENQCEKACILGIKDDPVAIGKLERFVADYENTCKKNTALHTDKKEYKSKAAFGYDLDNHDISTAEIKTGKIKTAVIGAGPAGLTCAGELAKMGYSVTLFEALHSAGGVLVYGIPEFRLPKSIVSGEVEYVKSLGVEIKLNCIIGKTFTIDELLENGYESIFIGTGAGLPYFLGIPGENLNGVYSANEYLTRVNLMKGYLFPQWDTPVKRAGIVSVIGGGNVALDSARTALRLGARKVYLIYRRTEVEMPGRIEEIKHAREEGVDMVFLTNPVEIKGENGWIKKLVCIRMELGEPDDSGRRRPIPVPNSEYEIDTEIAVIAIGQGPNPVLTQTSPDIALNKWGNIIADSSGKTSKKGVFAGGDIVTGAATVILAMGAGKNAAKAMDQYLKTRAW
ncbi:MAG: NADPH-dependent glutamate synthase [Actinobacteria bacterium]|nr:NADPH-dependent glutamate synthase [Actinomycetota bacterium]